MRCAIYVIVITVSLSSSRGWHYVQGTAIVTSHPHGRLVSQGPAAYLPIASSMAHPCDYIRLRDHPDRQSYAENITTREDEPAGPSIAVQMACLAAVEEVSSATKTLYITAMTGS